MKVVTAYEDDGGKVHKVRYRAVEADFVRDFIDAYNGSVVQFGLLQVATSLLDSQGIRSKVVAAIARYEASITVPEREA